MSSDDGWQAEPAVAAMSPPQDSVESPQEDSEALDIGDRVDEPAVGQPDLSATAACGCERYPTGAVAAELIEWQNEVGVGEPGVPVQNTDCWPGWRLDVNGDGLVTPLDALLIANSLQSPDLAPVDLGMLDVDGDVNIVATDPWALEQPQENGLPKPGQFEITRYNETDLTWSLTVYYQIGGTAINGQHYEYLPGSSSQYPSIGFVTIPAGHTSVLVDLEPINDDVRDLLDPDKTVILTLVNYSGGSTGQGAYTVGTHASGTVTIEDNDEWFVRAEEAKPRAYRVEQADGEITLRHYNETDLTHPVTVHFTVSGTAVPGLDYERLEGTTVADPFTGEITIPQGELTYTLLVVPLPSADPAGEPEPPVTVELQILEDPDAPTEASYQPRSPSIAEITIYDRDRFSPQPVYCVPSRCCLVMCGADDVVAIVDDQTGAVLVMVPESGQTHTSTNNPHPMVTVDVEFPEFSLDATSIVARLKFNDVDYPPVFYSTAGMVKEVPYRFALQADASGLADGHYEWELTVIEHYEDVPPLSRTYTGWRNVRNLIDSPLGNRWRLDDLDRLVVEDNGAMWIGGDGNLLWFQKLPDGSYLPPEGQLRGSSLVANGNGTFTVTDRHGEQSQFDQHGLLTSRVDRAGNTTAFSYIDLDRDGAPDSLSQTVDPAGRTTTFAYVDGRLDAITDYAGRVTGMTYDAAGRLTTVTRPDPDGSGSPEMQFTYDSATNLMTSYTTATGATTTLQYDAAGSLSSRVEPGGATYELSAALTAGWADISAGQGTYENPAPLLRTADVAATRTDPLSAGSSATVDRFGFPTSQTDALGHVTRMDRDHEGRVTRLVQPDPDGPGPLPAPETFFTYDDSGNLLEITHPDSTTETWTYESTFNQAISYTDRLGNLTLYQIDPADGNLLAVQRVVGQVDAPSNGETDDVVTSFSYTAAPSTSGDPPAGLLQTVTDPLGRVTAYEYNGRGLLVQITYAVGTVDEASVEFEYDAADNLTAQIDELGRRTEYTYDNLGRVTAIEGPDPDGNGGPVWTFQYDASGRVVAETDPLGRVTQYTYDSRGKPTAITGPDHGGTPTVTALEYDLAGRLTAMVDPLGRRTAFGYDAAEQMTSLTRPDPAGDGSQGGPVSGWTFDPLGRVVSQTDPLGNVTSLAYEDFGRRIVTTHPDPDGAGPLNSPVTVEQYDAAGNLIAATDALGRVTAYAYDPLGRMVRVTHPDPDNPSQPGAETEYQYDKAGNLRFVIDVLGNVTELIYDHRDRLVEMVQPDPDGLGSPQWTYTYDAAGQRLTETDPLGRTTSYQYDALGRVVERTLPDPDGPGPLAAPVYAYAYDLVGNLLSVTDPLNHTTSYSYDDFDRVLTVTDAISGVTSFAYDAGGQLLERTDPLNRTTAWTYDQLGRTITVTDPLHQTTAFAYDSVGNLLSVTDPLSHTISYAYDNLYRRTAVTDPLSGVTSFAYDAAGQLLQQTDPLSRTTSWDYDGLGRVTSVTDPLSQVTSYTYDAAGNLLSVTDPLNHTTSYSYDDLYRRTAVSDPLSGVTAFTFDLASNLTSLTDPVGNTTTWDYDGLNRVVAETNELNDARTFTYDAANNLLSRTDRDGRVIEYDYDALHRRVQEQWLDAQQTVIRTLSFTYDAASQLTAAADPAASYDYQYDALGRRTSVTHGIAGLGFPVVLASAYDAASNRTSLSATIDTTADFVNQYTYDALHRMTRIEQSGQSGGNTVAEKRIDLSYDAASQWQTITRYADLAATKLVATSDYTFDAAGRLTALTYAQGATPLAGYTWAYDAGHRVTEFTSLLDGTADYTYDGTDQLTGADYTYQGNEAYGYDANGNRTMTGYATGDNNLVLSDGVYDYQYDSEGNRTRRTHIATGEVTDYEWDHRNRLTRVTVKASDQGPVAKDILYHYDLFNRLVRVTLHTTDNGPLTTDTFHIYDGERWERGNAGDHLALVFDGNGDLTNRYLYGPAVDQILADEQLDSLTTPGDVLWPLTDNLGTVRDLAAYDDATGDTTVVNHRTYTAFGQILSETDPTVTHRFAYTARHWDEDAGLYYYRARWYDPVLGRFLTEDPIGFEAGDANLQRYVGNGVTVYTDASGLLQGHHIVPQAIWRSWPEPLRNVFDGKRARIFNEYYNFHNGLAKGGVTHDAYTQAVRGELRQFFGTASPRRITPKQAEDFVDHIWKTKNQTIQKFNMSTQVEAYAAEQMGERLKAKYMRDGLTPDAAQRRAKEETSELMKRARRQMNEIARNRNSRRLAESRVRLMANPTRFLRCIPFVSAATLLCQGSDLNAAARELALDLSGLDMARDLGLGLGHLYDMMLEDAEEARRATWGSGGSQWIRQPGLDEEKANRQLHLNRGIPIDRYGRFQ